MPGGASPSASRRTCARTRLSSMPTSGPPPMLLDVKAGRAQSIDRVFSLFLRLSERKGQLARTLSGGEQQMLALGRGLMALPRLLMVDEPFLGLAPQVMEQMKSVFEALKAEGMAILFIEQNVRLALSMAGRGYILESGRLAIHGPSNELLNSIETRRIFLGG